MPHIVLTEEQARVVSEAEGVIEVRDPRGQPLASLMVFCPDRSQAANQNGGARTPGYPAGCLAVLGGYGARTAGRQSDGVLLEQGTS